MAAALIPLAVNAAETYGPGLIKLLASLVHKNAPAAQAAYPASGAGPVRFADVFTAVKTKMLAAADAGQIDKTKVPDDSALKVMIECMVQTMDIGGLLTPAGTSVMLGSPPIVPAAGQSQTVTLAAGQSLTITVK